MTIDKVRVDRSLRNIRGFYRHHVEGELSPSTFVTKARAELSALYVQHTKGLIEATASRFFEELLSFQAQFDLDLDCGETHLTRVTRGFRGIRASMNIRNKVYIYSSGWVEVFIGPFDEWDKVAVHTIEEREFGNRPSFYTKRMRSRWQAIQDFDFPDLLQRIKEDAERSESEDSEDDIPF
jgi:hypothetical protein